MTTDVSDEYIACIFRVKTNNIKEKEMSTESGYKPAGKWELGTLRKQDSLQ
jgi:hypothetical protein